MSWVLAFLGFAVLIVLHEFGHFVVAKWVGMRVERFSLFFPPLIWRRKGRGETEYAIGAIPLGGYVKISGMNPHEELPPEVAHRAYFRQPVWKRIAVILAGPVMNLLIAFAIFGGLFLSNGVPGEGARVEAVQPDQPATGVLRPGDRILSVDGVSGTATRISEQIGTHRCKGTPKPGCKAVKPAVLVIERGDRTFRVSLHPEYDAEFKRTRLGFSQSQVREDVGAGGAAAASAEQMWELTTRTVTTVAQIFDPQKREEISGVVGSYEVTRQAVQINVDFALFVLGVISLSLAVINLFPFLPLDGGHIFWALAEKVRGRAIPFSVMERAGFVGFALVLFLFFIGLSNDLDRLAGEGFDIAR
ncbi:MAG TPA: M50 family metallopeptidase [Solirubrobacteraceae bacterium]|nr:M50 family metallopeptidase [Solirubrobacteraceae bacterium]